MTLCGTHARLAKASFAQPITEFLQQTTVEDAWQNLVASCGMQEMRAVVAKRHCFAHVCTRQPANLIQNIQDIYRFSGGRCRSHSQEQADASRYTRSLTAHANHAWRT